MVQRKVQNKLGIQVEHVKSDKTKVSDMKKKMKKPKSIKISNLDETLQLQSPQKQHPPNGSPNYMKPTRSSHAKKELFSVSLRKTQSCSGFNRKFSSDSKILSKVSTSLSLVRTLTKTTSFKASRVCSRKSTRASICVDVNPNPHRATCSSTLKDSKFPSYLKLNHGGTELEGTSVMKVCSYTYCSLNGHHHNHHYLPPLKTFISSRRRVLKRVKVEALSPRSRRLKGFCEMEKELDVEKKGFVEVPEYDEIGMDFFVDIYADEKKDAESKGEERNEKTDFLEEDEDHEDAIKSTVEDQKDEDKGQQTSWSHEEMSIEDVENSINDSDSDSETDEMECDDEEQFYGFDHENDDDSFVYKDEENDSKSESLSESSHDVSVTWLDDILSIYYDDIILVDEKLKEEKSEEIIYLEEQPHDENSGSNEIQEIGYPSSDVGYDRSSLADEIFDHLTNAEENVDETSEENKDKNINREEKSLIQPSPMGFELCPLRPIDETLTADLTPDEQNSPTQLFDLVEQSIKAIQDQGKGNKRACIVDNEENSREDWKGVIRRKGYVEDEEDDEMRKFNPRGPNFLPLVPEKEKEKVDLRHQMMDERKNAEEWMVDCALRQVVNKLAPARKKKVALLVEAFETVIPKCESHLRNNSEFHHKRHIQACS